MNRISRKKHGEGFVLVSVLGVILLLSFVASFVSDLSDKKVQEAAFYKESWSEALDQDATLATVLFYLSVGKPTYGGFSFDDENILMTDSRLYKGIGNNIFSIQEESSLLSLMIPDEQRWLSLLNSMDVPRYQSESFLAQLQDYTDKDDLKRINGATSFDYEQTGTPPPSHRFMSSPGQIYNLLGAADWREWLVKILPYITDKSGQMLNINSMPTELLKTLPGWDPALVQDVVRERETKPFSSLSDANNRISRLLPLDELSVTFYPGTYHRIKIWPSENKCFSPLWVGVSLSHSSLISPWDINYVFNTEKVASCFEKTQFDSIFSE